VAAAKSAKEKCGNYAKRVQAEECAFVIIDYSPEQLDGWINESCPETPDELMKEAKGLLYSLHKCQQDYQEWMNERARELVGQDITRFLVGIKTEQQQNVIRKLEAGARESLHQVGIQMEAKTTRIVDDMLKLNSRVTKFYENKAGVCQRLRDYVKLCNHTLEQVQALHEHATYLKNEQHQALERAFSSIHSLGSLIVEEQAASTLIESNFPAHVAEEQPSTPIHHSHPPLRTASSVFSPRPISKLSDVIEMTRTELEEDTVARTRTELEEDTVAHTRTELEEDTVAHTRTELEDATVARRVEYAQLIEITGTGLQDDALATRVETAQLIELDPYPVIGDAEFLRPSSTQGSEGKKSSDGLSEEGPNTPKEFCDHVKTPEDVHQGVAPNFDPGYDLGAMPHLDDEKELENVRSIPLSDAWSATQEPNGSAEMRCSTASLCSTIEAGGKRSPPPGLDEVTKDHMETVTKCDYDFEKDQWNRTSMLCYIQDKPFDEGNLRRCHMMVGYEDDGLRRTYVAKEAKTDAGQDAYEKDIEMQEISQYLAKQYNQFSPPKKVEFLHAFLIQLDSRPLCPRTGKPQMRHVEPYLPGEYKKHNNNWGYVCKDRNTPQAFSHFTYHYSSRFLRHRIKSPIMVVDVQGVGDIFTDPQIHSEDGQGYGMGNCGYDGIKKFFNTHECNELCRFVGVKAHNFQANDSGTRAPADISQT
jgi:hypothetical protein